MIVAILCIVGGLFCSYLGYLFFRYVPAWIAGRFGSPVSRETAEIFGTLGLVIIFFSGYGVWRKSQGLQSYQDSALYPNLDISTGGGFVVNHYVGRVTGPSHVLSQIFLAGPLLLLRAYTKFKSLIPPSPGMEERLVKTLLLLRKASKWQSFSDYPDQETQKEILLLSKIGKIDFSSHQVEPRFKAHPEN